MDRRSSLKLIAWSTISTGVILDACKTDHKKTVDQPGGAIAEPTLDRMDEEKKAYGQLMKERFFTSHEMATVAILCDIIIPADGVSGSATDAKVPDFIEFMMKDKPELQTPMRGGLRWLDLQMMKQYAKPFSEVSRQHQIALVDQIAYPARARPAMQQGVHFFSLMRNLTASGFYTSEIGLRDIGYAGNQATQWNGVPADVLQQYQLAYTDKEMNECVHFD